MKLVVTEKNIAAQKIADLLGIKKPKADKVYNTPVYRFELDGEEWVTIGLRGHILEPDFVAQIVYKKTKGWQGVTADGEVVPADIPDFLAKPPYKTKRKPFLADGAYERRSGFSPSRASFFLNVRMVGRNNRRLYGRGRRWLSPLFVFCAAELFYEIPYI